jgi:hypothetical protein
MVKKQKQAENSSSQGENPPVAPPKKGKWIINFILFLFTIVLAAAAVYFIYQLLPNKYKDAFTCANLIGRLGLGQLCQDIRVDYDLLWVHIHTILFPGLKVLDPALNSLREFIIWTVLIFFALVSVVVTFVVSKLSGFIKLLMTQEGRRIVLSRMGIWLFVFAALCALFYFGIRR